MDKKILIIGTKESFIVRVLLKKLADAKIDARFIMPEVAEIDKYWLETSLVTFYMEKDEALPDDVRIFLADKMDADDKKMILIAEPLDIEKISNSLPPGQIYASFERPLDYDAYIKAVNSYSDQAEHGDLMKKILIVDDDPNYMSLIRSWLNEHYKVSMATSGLRAIKWLGSNKVDLILLDYEMPVTDGPQVLEMLRDDEEMKNIPVIFLTGRDDKQSVMSVMELKPQGYFIKSIKRDELLMKLKTFFMNQDQK